MQRTLFAFNGDLESRLALHWLVHECGQEVISLSINVGQEVDLSALGELALDLGASAAQVVDCREIFVRDFAFPLLQAGAVYQSSCYLGSALARYVIAQELVRLAREEGCTTLAHGAAGKGNDQVRMETAIAALDADLRVIAPVRQWHLNNLASKIDYAHRHDIPIEEPTRELVSIDRNLWEVSIYVHNLEDAWSQPPAEVFVRTRSPEQAPAEPLVLTLGFELGVPCRLNGELLGPVSLVRELNRLGGEHGIGRSDVVEDRLFGIKSREFYEAPTPTILWQAHRDLESLVLTRELRQLKDWLGRRYAELAYTGLWFHETRQALDAFFQQTQRHVTGEVQLKLYKGTCSVLGRRSPFSLYDSELANQSEVSWFDNRWAEGFTSVSTLASRLVARQQVSPPPK